MSPVLFSGSFGGLTNLRGSLHFHSLLHDTLNECIFNFSTSVALKSLKPSCRQIKSTVHKHVQQMYKIIKDQIFINCERKQSLGACLSI